MDTIKNKRKKRNYIILSFHIVLLLLIVSVYLNEFIKPSTSPYFGFISLILPILIIIHFALTFNWLIKRNIIFIPMLAVSIFLFISLKKYVHFSKFPKNKGKIEKLKNPYIRLMSYNIQYANSGKDVNSLDKYVNMKEIDIAFFQEIYTRQWRTKEAFLSNRENAVFDLIGISSKFPIVKKQKILLPHNGYACYADININEDTIRCFNIYLDPFKISPTLSNIVDKMESKYITRRLIAGQKKHQEQIQVINNYIKESPYSVIIAGDFNSVPLSYEYFALKQDYIDVFEKKGSGLGFTFYDYYYPLRIDYIFISPQFYPLNSYVDKKARYSDHYPVISDIKLK